MTTEKCIRVTAVYLFVARSVNFFLYFSMFTVDLQNMLKPTILNRFNNQIEKNCSECKNVPKCLRKTARARIQTKYQNSIGHTKASLETFVVQRTQSVQLLMCTINDHKLNLQYCLDFY